MKRPGETVSAVDFGHDVLGPIVGEFCLRLWSLASQLEHPGDTALLFCARGGLRMQLAYERFLATAGLPSPVAVAPLQVSRVAAVRPALLRTVDERLNALVPAASTTLSHEFGRATLADVATAVAGMAPRDTDVHPGSRFTPDRFAAFLRHAGGAGVVDGLREQSGLFARHLAAALGPRRHAVLVDTGLYGTTRALLAEGALDHAGTGDLAGLEVSSALFARSFRPGSDRGRTVGLSVQAEDYVPHRRRTAVLRYWHFVEWLFEPDLPSVRTFALVDGEVRSNLEVTGWERKVAPPPGSPFAGVLAYLDALPRGGAGRVVADADAAWDVFRRAVVWPRPEHGRALAVGTRSHDFGLDATWSARPWQGPLGALRGSSMWREGEIASSGSALRRPLLAAIETAHGARRAHRVFTRSRSIRTGY